MPSPLASTLLRRMAGSDRDAPAAADAAPSPLERALATAAFRVADGLPGLGLSVADRRSSPAPVETAFDDLPQQGLCLLVDPPLPADAPRLGADALAAATGTVVLDPALVDGLVELQTIGRIDGAARPARRPTRIDAALCQPFAAALMEEVSGQLPRDHFGPRPGPLRTGTFLSGTGSLPVALTAPSWLVVTLEVALGDGVRPARIDLLLPDAAAADDPVVGEEIALPDPDWQARMDAAAKCAPVRLDAVLPPLRMTLADLVGLSPGDVIELDGTPLQELRLISGASGRGRPLRARMPYGLAVCAKLGRFGTSRAVRLSADPGAPADRPGEGDGHVLPPQETTLALPGGSGEGVADVAGQGVEAADALPGLPDLPEEEAPLDLADLPDLPELPDLPGMD